MRKKFALLALLFIVPILAGCPGNRGLDKEANDKLWAWVEAQDSNGWQIVGAPNTNYKNIVISHEFKPTRLRIAIDGDAVNPIHQRNMIEQIAREWRNSYPANMRPRFNLRVEIFNKEINRSMELGYTEIDTDGNVDTHHSKTQDIM